MNFKFSRLIRYLFNRYKKRNLIGIWINEDYIFNHYEAILDNVSKDKFELILERKYKNSKSPILKKIHLKNWHYSYMDDVIDKFKYRYLITHLAFGEGSCKIQSFPTRAKNLAKNFLNKVRHVFRLLPKAISTKEHFQVRLGEVNFRLMYGADLNDQRWPSNQVYDLFFCHGPHDAHLMEANFNAQTLIVGYPKYDKYFINHSNLQKKEKVNLLFIFTVSLHFSTITSYFHHISPLSNKYNITIRPHPLEIDPKSTRFNEKVYELAKSNPKIFDLNPSKDLSELYSEADFVITDYGGSIFSALYLDKKILLLDHPDAINDIGSLESNSLEARDFLPSLDLESGHKLQEIIDSNDFDVSLPPGQIAYRTKYFGQIKGGCIPIIANYLNSLTLD